MGNKPWFEVGPDAMLAECGGQLSVSPGQRGLLSEVSVSDLKLYGLSASLVCWFPEKATEAESQHHRRGRNLCQGNRRGRKTLGPSCRAGRVDSRRKCSGLETPVDPNACYSIGLWKNGF